MIENLVKPLSSNYCSPAAYDHFSESKSHFQSASSLFHALVLGFIVKLSKQVFRVNLTND